MTTHGKPWLLHKDPNVPEEINYDNMPVTGFLDQAVEEFPNRKAVIYKNYSLTYSALQKKAEQVAFNLRAMGVSPGDKVAIMLPNLPQTIIAYWGVLKAGATAVMTNPLYMETEIVHHFNDSGAKVLITLDLLWAKIDPLREQLNLKKIIVTNIPESLKFPLTILSAIKFKRAGQTPVIPFDNKTIVPWKKLFTFKERYSHEYENPREAIALLQYTGGTTGLSKGCILTHENLVANCTQCRGILHSIGKEHETFVNVLPFFHVYGLTVGLNFPSAIGATVLPFPRFEPAEILATFKTRKPSIFPGAPSIYVALMRQKEFKNTDFSSLKYCVSGSAPMPVDLMERFNEQTGAVLLEGYGLSEASPVTHFNPLHGTSKSGTIGFPLPSTDARVVDMEDGETDLPPGEPGELLIKGPQVMAGYWNRPDATAETVKDGWLYTGDIAVMDDEGYFSIVDRKKDLIITAGYNVYPREVDEVLFSHPDIEEAVTVGIPDKTRGELIKAFIIPKKGAKLTRTDIIAFCKSKLAHYKVPRKVEFRTELPKTLVGKVLRRALRDEEIEKTKKKKK